MIKWKGLKVVKGKIISKFVFFVSLYVVIAVVIIVVNRISEYQRAQKTYIMLQDNLYQDGVIDWEALAGTETVAWIHFENKPTAINYPVVQHSTNRFYLTRMYNGEKNRSGSIFMDKLNNPMLTDKNTIIYGHNMKDGSMFHDLRYFMDQNYWKENKIFYLFLPDGSRHAYEIFSVNQVYEDGYIYDIEYSNDDDFEATMQDLYKTCIIQTDLSVAKTDRIVTLSTCMNNETNQRNRLVVCGIEKEVKQVQEPASWYSIQNELKGVSEDAAER